MGADGDDIDVCIIMINKTDEVLKFLKKIFKFESFSYLYNFNLFSLGVMSPTIIFDSPIMILNLKHGDSSFWLPTRDLYCS